MSNLSQYFRPQYARGNMYKFAAQPPMDPSMMAGGGMPMDPSMMAGGAPPMDPSMMTGGMPPQGMPMDPSMMGGAPPMDPSMMAGAMPPAPPAADPAAAAADPTAATGKMSAKQQKEELMNGIQASLDDIKDYTYNNLMILVEIAKALNVNIPADALISPPDGKNMDIMADPSAIAAAAAPDAGAMAPQGMPPMDPNAGMPPAEQAPSEVKMSMYRMMGIPQDLQRAENIKQAMNYYVNKDSNRIINNFGRLVNR